MAATKPRCSCRPSTRGAPGPTARTIATRIYGADGVEYPKKVDRQIAQAEALGYGRLPVCVAKTQRSLSGDITTMPGLPRKPNAEGVDVTPDGVITGLF